MDIFSESHNSNLHDTQVVIINKRSLNRKLSPKSPKTESTDHCGCIPEPATSPQRFVRINIRHRGPIRSRMAQVGVIWTTHDVSVETKLCDLFHLHHLEGGPQPRAEVLLQQITRYLTYMDGTEKYWWSELAPERIVDVNWAFEDNEVWLDCSIVEVS